ncbi:hypothetical protein KP509_34G071400 [Ceratopteris richardii]|uniref:Uncharacterized protein n=1 Tax=Ceratopteris richardii TaxID=49495 RepID=A0A8T2QML2_CERRI|nr:hypothetical protein KP509_34G071400 [Ceratopteris richardii]
MSTSLIAHFPGFTCVRSNVIFSHLHVGLQSSDAKACHRCQQNFVNSLSCGSLSTFRSSTSRLHVGKPTCAYKSTLLFSVTTYHEQSETEDPLEADVNPTQKYSWADIKKPRICILGGGFGGLYTALRLESLVWPADKKPQVFLLKFLDL